MLRRLARWLLRNEAQPQSKLTIYPYTTAVHRHHYLAAWDRVRVTEEGELIIKTFHNNLVAVLEERCPEDYRRNVEAMALWQAGHDARKKVLLDLTLQAIKGTGLLPKPKPLKKQPQLVAGGV